MEDMISNVRKSNFNNLLSFVLKINQTQGFL
jgi:hypothetical protein